MPISARRVVTGHDEDGSSVVLIDDRVANGVSKRPGHESALVWSTGELPADVGTREDGAKRAVGTIDPNGSVFRFIEFQPGVAPRSHRTDSIDYAVVLRGEIDLELDAGCVNLRAGDVVVQRGTMHNWVNRGTEPCLMLFVLIAAKPIIVKGDVLPACA